MVMGGICHCPPPSQGHLTPSVMPPPPVMPKYHLFDNLVKNLTVVGVLRKNIWFSVLIPKIKFDPSPEGKMLWCSYFWPLLNSQIFPEWEILLVLLGKL